MGKTSEKKRLKAQLLNELSKRENEEITRLKNRIDYLEKKNQEYCEKNYNLNKENKSLKDENNSLQEKIRQYEEWIDRMQDFCNLPENEREKAMTDYVVSVQKSKENNEILNGLLGRMGMYYGLFN